ncbi:MAG: trypsin-like peptidase domain-containing protein [Phycisphaerae bacterium]|nr:trypsin-like peptidase domain-containing protein [Phycisphaerae bacterium]
MGRSSLLSRRSLPTESRWGSLWLVATLLFLASILVAPRTNAGSEPPAAADSLTNLAALQDAFQQVVERVSPSVVGIRAYRRHLTTLSGADTAAGGAGIEQRVLVNGSGTILTENGLILTNEHVVQSADDIAVLLHDGSELPATVLKSDPRSDLAILQVERSDLTPVTMCDWDTVARGQWSLVLGNPFGLGGDGQLSVAVGVVSNLGRQLPGLGEVDDRFYNDMIQTTAPISPGHSGGPLFNVRGELIGVVTAMHTRAPADEGIGFAIPMTPAKRRVIDLLCRGRTIEYGYLGLTVRVPEPEEREVLGLEGRQGVVVQRIEPAGPAAKAGIRVGDVLLAYAQRPVSGPAQLAELVGQTPAGTWVRLDLLRNRRPLSESVTIARRDVSRVSWMRDRAVLWRGMRVTDLTDDVRRIMGGDAALRGVLVIDVLPDTPAERADVQIGNLIEGIAGEPIQDTAEFRARTRAASGPLEMSIRNRGTRTVTP